jgi:aryl-alcohol dehydrogenase-like predicted oxidoreductase
MSVIQTGKMIYRNFGNSGLKLSVISVGTAGNYKPDDYEQDKEIIAASLRNGINHFDTAEIYGLGES